MNALVIGGTRFIGRHTVAELLEHDYDVTLFNRGNHENPVESDIEHIEGDRTNEADLELADFPLYLSYPHVLSTAKLSELGWEATPIKDALERTVTNHRESDRTGRENGPDRDAAERVLSVLDTL